MKIFETVFRLLAFLPHFFLRPFFNFRGFYLMKGEQNERID